jgi:hypothetical protein
MIVKTAKSYRKEGSKSDLDKKEEITHTSKR